MIALSKTQESIVKAPIGEAIQVLASAGSGKTRVLTERVRHILTTTKKESVIALTFTNKAAEEMQQRLDDTESVEERVWIGTIHSVAQRMLEQYGHTIDLPSELHIYERDKDRMEVFLQSLRDQGVDIDDYLTVSDAKERRNRERVMQQYMDTFSTIKRNLLTSEEEIAELFPEDSNRIWKVYQDYQNALLDSGGIDFDDILIRTYELLQTHEWIANIYRAKYKHICVDEAQDLNKAQYEFIKALCGHGITSVLMVGDPNQMIYGFNGSSSDYLCRNFIEDFKPECFELKENYRSAENIIRAANKLKPGSQQEGIAALSGIAHLIPQADENVEARWIVDKIKALLELSTHAEIEGEILLSRMAVIARNRFVFTVLEKTLSDSDIAFSLKKSERSTEPDSLFGKVLDFAIRIRLNPKAWVDGKKLCQFLKVKHPDQWGDSEFLTKLASQVVTSDIHFPELQSELLQVVQGLDINEPNIRKFKHHFELKLKELVKTVQNDQDRGELERSIKELDDFYLSWTRFKRKRLGDSLQSYRNAKSLGQLAEDVITDGLTLSTVHTMKGLEKDIVFLMGMCEGVFPDYRAKSPFEMNEEQNSAFVAVTRAKRWLYITYPQRRTMPWGDERIQQVSRFMSGWPVFSGSEGSSPERIAI